MSFDPISERRSAEPEVYELQPGERILVPDTLVHIGNMPSTGYTQVPIPDAILSFLNITVLEVGKGIIVSGSGMCSYLDGSRVYNFSGDNKTRQFPEDNRWYAFVVYIKLCVDAIFHIMRVERDGEHVGLDIIRQEDSIKESF